MPRSVCTALKTFEIEEDKCKGCSKCARICPASAITGELKSPFKIDQSKCIKCGACINSCPFKAIIQK
jgi:NADH-quinone oxidoreductase subunit F